MGLATDDTLKQLEEHLASELKLKQRENDFDMDDAPEAQVLSPFPEIESALRWLATNVALPWRNADREALRSQSLHRLLARVAMVTGTSAIVLAVVQLSIKLTLPRFAAEALILELFAVAAAVVAVAVGLKAKADRRWLGQRHLAERLRMLKFRALEQLWCKDSDSWQRWVEDQLKRLDGAGEFDLVEKWSKGGRVEAEGPTSAECGLNSARALTVYYRYKRLEYQADYFERRRQKYEGQTSRWRHLNLPLFFASVVCVFGHFFMEVLGHWLGSAGHEVAAAALESSAIWFVALAAIIPVLGIGVRSWFAAFQLPLSASLYESKHNALIDAAKHLEAASGDVDATLRHMTQDEHFLEGEHREWLRLLLDTEWFL